MNPSFFLDRAMMVMQAASPSATPAPDPTAAGTSVPGNYLIAALLFVGSVGVIALALRFAWLYHSKVLAVITEAVKDEGAPIGSEIKDALALSARFGPSVLIHGPEAGTTSAKLTYSLVGLPPSATVSWEAQGGDPSKPDGASEPTFSTRFDKAGKYTITATYTVDGKASKVEPKKVVIVAAAAPKSAPSIVLPFVLQNWGRLVIVLLGVGVISALMAIRVLDAAAGVGILGTLLGVGAVSATGGTSGEKPTKSSDD